VKIEIEPVDTDGMTSIRFGVSIPVSVMREAMAEAPDSAVVVGLGLTDDGRCVFHVGMPDERAVEEEQDGAVDFADLLDRSRPVEEA
jgi:hypothetical protein